MVYRVAREGVPNERIQVRVDLNVLYGYVNVFMGDMTNPLMSSDEVRVAAKRDAYVVAPDGDAACSVAIWNLSSVLAVAFPDK